MNQRVAFHTLSAPEREGDDIQVQFVTIRLGQGTRPSPFHLSTGHHCSTLLLPREAPEVREVPVPHFPVTPPPTPNPPPTPTAAWTRAWLAHNTYICQHTRAQATCAEIGNSGPMGCIR